MADRHGDEADAASWATRLGALAAPLLDAVASPLFVKNARSRFVFVNDALCRFVGLSRDQLLGRGDADVFPAEQARMFLERDRKVFESGEPDVTREHLRGADGTDRIIVTRKSQLTDEHGDCFLVGIIEDVTEREQSEARVRRAHAAMEALLEAVPMPLFVRDRARRYRFANRAYCEFVGRGREALLGTRDESVYREREHLARPRARDDRVFAGEGPLVNDVLLTDAQGRERSVQVHRALVETDLGEPAMVGVLADVTELKDARETMRIAAQVFEHTAEGIVVADAELRVVSVNHAFEVITGYREEEVLGEDATTLLDGGQLGDSLGEAVRRGLQASGQWQGEVTGRRRTGELYPAWATVSVVRDGVRPGTRYIAIFSDVTERKASEDRVRWLAQHDMLTGLANRSLLEDRAGSALRRARRYGHRVALMAVDLDHFKGVNDRLGHQVGDQVLVQAGKRMCETVRATDTVARSGGDEFAVLLSDPKEEMDADAVAMKIVERLSEPFRVEDHVVRVGASIGIAVYPDHADDLPTLLGVADRSMYRVKQQGRGGVARYGAPVSRFTPGGWASGTGAGQV